jgi:hypothetical protein
MGGSFFSCPVKRNTKKGGTNHEKRSAVAMAPPLPLLFIKAVINQKSVFQREDGP